MHRGKDYLITCRTSLNRAVLRTVFGTRAYILLVSLLDGSGRHRGLHLSKFLIVLSFRQVRILTLLSEGASAVLKTLITVIGN